MKGPIKIFPIINQRDIPIAIHSKTPSFGVSKREVLMICILFISENELDS
jgi:hypothetical protein